MKHKKRNRINLIKKFILAGFYLVIFLFVPIGYILNDIDEDNLEKRKKTTECEVIGIKGLKQRTITVLYKVGNVNYTTFKEAPSMNKPDIGDFIKVYYDSIDPKNVKVLWDTRDTH